MSIYAVKWTKDTGVVDPFIAQMVQEQNTHVDNVTNGIRFTPELDVLAPFCI